MSEAVSGLVPYAHVADVERSIAFYWMLGFEVRATRPHEGRLGWAFLQCGEARLMLAAATGTIEADAQAVLFYLYCRDVAALREQLLTQGVEVGEVTHPDHMPAGEIRLHDPDGYCLLIGQPR
jgi:catechol 2,3-dioxygenase-like lactoylglutathione lyase family enzyme